MDHRVEQGSVRVEVDFFDGEERQKLLRYPTAERILRVIEEGLEIPIPEFLTYLIWHRQQLGTADYRTRSAIKRKLDVAESILDGCVVLTGRSICMPIDATVQLTEIAEHVGEAVGLSAIDRIHGLTEADWQVIPKHGGRGAPPTFDFEIASDGVQIIQLEAKGSSAEYNGALEPSVRAQKRRIAEKKRKLDVLADSNRDPHPAQLRYGTITVLDRRQNGNARCWLVDPEPEDLLSNPRAARLLSRVRFLREWISFLGPRSQLAAALATRAIDLETMRDPFELSNRPLLRGNGEPFEIETYDVQGRHPSFFATKPHVSDGPAGGTLLQASSGRVFFAGIREQLLVLAAEQDFEAIVGYEALTGVIEKSVECILSEARFLQLNLPREIQETAYRSHGYVRFTMDGALNYSPAGLVFGFLDVHNN